MAQALVLAAALTGGAIGFIETARPEAPPATLAAGAEVSQVYAGLRQHGSELGRPDAPATMLVYVDPQCPYCGEWERVAMPELVSQFVRPGKLRVVVRGLRFVGPDSDTALRLLQAAALQHRFFQAAALLYASQGEENSGWVTDDYLRSLAYSVPGADPVQLLAQQSSSAVTARIEADEAAAARDRVSGTPSVFLGRTGGTLRPVELTSLDAAAVTSAIERLPREGAA